MAMNLSIACPHCESKAGELCNEDCSANGTKIKNLNKALKPLGLSEKNITLNNKILSTATSEEKKSN